MKPVNMIGKCKGWQLLIELLSMDMQYTQASEILAEQEYYVPQDQFNALDRAFNIQLDLDIGTRQAEVGEAQLKQINS